MEDALSELFLKSVQANAGVAQPPMLMMRYEAIRNVLMFINSKPEMRYAAVRLEKHFGDPNWMLNPRTLEETLQIVGEAQFLMIADAANVPLCRIPEADKKSADFATTSPAPKVGFEVKTLSVVEGQWSLHHMTENAYQAQLSLRAQIATGKEVAIAETVIAPHGAPKSGVGRLTAICRRLIDKTQQNIKLDQFRGMPTYLVLNLMLIDGGSTGNADLRPVVPGYPHTWSIQTGALWTLAFGKMNQTIQSEPEFEGAPGIEGELEAVGILVNPDYKEIAGLLYIVHPLSGPSRIFGLRRACDGDAEATEVFMRLTGNNWNDDVDSNGWYLAEH